MKAESWWGYTKAGYAVYILPWDNRIYPTRFIIFRTIVEVNGLEEEEENKFKTWLKIQYFDIIDDISYNNLNKVDDGEWLINLILSDGKRG